MFKKAYYLNDLKWPKIDKNCPIFPQFREEYHDFKAFCQQPYLAVSIEKKVTAISLFLLVILLKRFLAILELTKIVPGVGRAGEIVGSAKFHTSSIRYLGYQKMKNFQESFVPIIDQKWAGQGFKCIHTGYLVHHKISQ